MKKKMAITAGILIVVFLLAAAWQYGYTYILKNVYPIKYSDLIEKYSGKNSVDPALVYAVIKNESNFDPDAQSSVGALGLMQLTPETFRWGQSKSDCKDRGALTDNDLYTPEVNIKYGTLVLSLLINEFKDEQTALAAYHAGRSCVKKWLENTQYSSDGKTLSYIPYDTTRSYVKKVMKTKNIYSKLYFNK